MVQKVAAIDIGDLLYFGILIVGAVYSWIKKTQDAKVKEAKKFKGKTVPEKAPSSSNPMEDFLKEIIEPGYSKKYQTESLPEIENGSQDDVFETKKPTPIEDDLNQSSNNGIILEDTIKMESSSSTNYGSIRYQLNGAKKEFNLKDMVIIDTILNRPYK